MYVHPRKSFTFVPDLTLQLDSLVANRLAGIIVLSQGDAIAHGDGRNLNDLVAERDVGLIAVIRSSGSELSIRLLDGSTVGQAMGASATRDDDVANVTLEGGVLVEDGLPVGLDGADAAGDDLVKERNDRLLGKVLLLGALGVVISDGRVHVVVADPGVAVGKGSAVLGVKGVRVQRVARLVNVHGDANVAVHLDVVTTATGRLGSR